MLNFQERKRKEGQSGAQVASSFWAGDEVGLWRGTKGTTEPLAGKLIGNPAGDHTWMSHTSQQEQSEAEVASALEPVRKKQSLLLSGLWVGPCSHPPTLPCNQRLCLLHLCIPNAKFNNSLLSNSQWTEKLKATGRPQEEASARTCPDVSASSAFSSSALRALGPELSYSKKQVCCCQHANYSSLNLPWLTCLFSFKCLLTYRNEIQRPHRGLWEWCLSTKHLRSRPVWAGAGLHGDAWNRICWGKMLIL